MLLNSRKSYLSLQHKSSITTLLLYAQIVSTFFIYYCSGSPLLSEQDYEEPMQANLPITHTAQRNAPPTNLSPLTQAQQQIQYSPSTSWSQSSQNQKKNLKNSESHDSISKNQPLSTSFFEGSGDGPIKPHSDKQQKDKFDDTEGDDDNDEDDEDDYDDRDSLDLSSEPVVDSLKVKKPHSTDLLNKTERKPLLGESETSYLNKKPHSPAGVIGGIDLQNQTLSLTSSIPPMRQSILLSNTTSDIVTSSNFNLLKNDYFNQNLTSSPPKNESSSKSLIDIIYPTSKPSSTSSITTTFNNPHLESATKFKSTVSYGTSSTTFRPKLDHIIPIAASMPSLNTGIHRNKFSDSNSSIAHTQNISTTLEHNYDYEEDWEDEEPEETDSTFEDNDFSYNSTTQGGGLTNDLPSNNVTLKPLTTLKPTPQTIPILNFTAKPSLSQATPTELSSATNLPPNLTSSIHTYKPYINPISSENSTSSFPVSNNENSFVPGTGDYGDDDEEDDDEDEEDEEDEETINDNDYEDPVSEPSTPSSLRPALAIHDFRTTTIKPEIIWSTTSSSTTIHDDSDDDDDDDDVNDDNLETPFLNENTQSPTTSTTTIISNTSASTTAATTTTTITTTTTTATTLRPYEQMITIRPTVLVDSVQHISNSVPISTFSEPTISPIVNYLPSQAANPSTIATTAQNITVIQYATTPKSRAILPMTKVPTAPIYNRDEEADLTTQLYEKAVEVYLATNKAIQAALEMIWPPTFELNSSTFEPLIAQPLLFMMTLGAAVIGLVLTMMLIVYIVSYQIQPKDDDISIYM